MDRGENSYEDREFGTATMEQPVKSDRPINERKSPLDPAFNGPVATQAVPEEKPEQFVVQTQFDLLVTPSNGESLADMVSRALAVYKYEKGIKVIGMTHKSYIPSENN